MFSVKEVQEKLKTEFCPKKNTFYLMTLARFYCYYYYFPSLKKMGSILLANIQKQTYLSKLSEIYTKEQSELIRMNTLLLYCQTLTNQTKCASIRVKSQIFKIIFKNTSVIKIIHPFFKKRLYIHLTLQKYIF